MVSLKAKLLAQLAVRLETELATIRDAWEATHAAATHAEAKAENKYDTRGLEASYLAGAQKERVAELEATLESIKTTVPREFAPGEKIAPTALVELEQDGGGSLQVFVLRFAAGYLLHVDGHAVQTVTVGAPLGRALLGRVEGDGFSLEGREGARDYEIVGVR